VEFEIVLVSCITAAALAIPGVFLALKNMCMVSDSITHTVILGIVLGFFVTKDLSSPLLIIGATLTGLLTVYLTESLYKTKLVSEESAIGVVFPLLFSIAVLLITLFASNVHLDTDSVLLGELAFIPFDRLVILGVDLGPKALYFGLGLLLINLAVTLIFYKEIKLSIFDYTQCALYGFRPWAIHYLIMSMVSLSAVISFNVAGSILVVAFLSIPAITSYLICKDFKQMIITSVLVAVLNSSLGCVFAFALDVSIAGSIAVVSLLMFLRVFLFSKKAGLLMKFLDKRKRREEYLKSLVLYYINKEGNFQKACGIVRDKRVMKKLVKEGIIKNSP